MSSHPSLKHLDLENLQGLNPSVWILCDVGVSREAVKDYLFESEISFISEAVHDYQSLCLTLLKGLLQKENILVATSREEILRYLLRTTFREKKWVELRKLRHQKGFYKKLDQSIQSLRLIYGSEPERIAQVEKLNEFPSQIREEVFSLVEFYEDFLKSKQLWDLPRLLVATASICGNESIELKLPLKIQFLTPKRPESRAEYLLDELSKRCEVERLWMVSEDEPFEEKKENQAPILYSKKLSEKCRLEIFQTLDDAAEFLSEDLKNKIEKGDSLSDYGILMPDEPEVRRSLSRALNFHKLKLKDGRDPTLIRMSEEIKNALLPLRLIHSHFSQPLLVEYALSVSSKEESFLLIQKIYDSAEREGLSLKLREELIHYPEFLEKCDEIQKTGEGKKTITEWKEIHLKGTPHNVSPFLEKCWDQYIRDLILINEEHKKRSLPYFLERFLQRLNEATPPVEKTQVRNGLELYRLGVTPMTFPKHLMVFGLPTRFTNIEEFSDYALSSRDRELLSSAFLLRSHHDENRFRKNLLKCWIEESESVTFLDAKFNADGRERERLHSVFKELGVECPVEEKGSVWRLKNSFISQKEKCSRLVQLSKDHRTSLRASEIESYSRCGFQALLRGRWKLKGLRKSELEIREDLKGILLHEAVFHLISSRDDFGNFNLTVEESLNRSLRKNKLKGLLRSPRIERMTIKKLKKVLEDFLESETKWWEKARTFKYALEGPELASPMNGVVIHARPDRVDEHPDGLWLIDYKTGSASPHGSETLAKNYRLQLPLYALLLKEKTGKTVLGYQIVELRKKGSRSKGLTIEKYFGKHEGALLQSPRKESASVIGVDSIESVWKEFHEKISNDLQSLMNGRYEIKPRNKDECARCFARDACGERRFIKNEEVDEEAHVE